jgi:hypothetical protein
VLKRGDKLTAIEVKGGNESLRQSGMDAFIQQFNPTRVLLIGPRGIQLKQFLSAPIDSWL